MIYFDNKFCSSIANNDMVLLNRRKTLGMWAVLLSPEFNLNLCGHSPGSMSKEQIPVS